MLKKLSRRYALSLFLITLTLFVNEVAGQEVKDSSTPHNLTVLRQLWRVTRSSPPIINPPDPEQYQRDLLNTIEENKKRSEAGLQPVSVPNPPRRTLKPASKDDIYIYELWMKNTGNKKIKAITWEYVFFDPNTKQELGRRKFASKIKIRLGEEKNIKETSSSPPAYLVGALAAGNTLPNQYTEEIVIRSVEYTDGSIWNLENK